MDPNNSLTTNAAKTWDLYADEEFDFPHISPCLAFPPVKSISKPVDSNGCFKAPQKSVATFSGPNSIARNAADLFQTFKIQGHGLQRVNKFQSKKIAEVGRPTRKEHFGKKKPEQKGKKVVVNVKKLQSAENKITPQQSTAPLTFKRKLGKLSSLSEPPVSPLKKKLSSKTPSRIGERVGVTLSAARRREILSLDKDSILEAALNVMESRATQNLHILSKLAERTMHRENNVPQSDANGILYRGRRTSMHALRPKLAPSERVRLLRKKRAVRKNEVMALVPVMPLVPVSMLPTGTNTNGEPYRRILPKPSVVPLKECDSSANSEANGHPSLVGNQTISDRLNATPFIVQSIPSSVTITVTADGKRSARKRKNNPSTESRTHQWRLKEAEEESKEKDSEKESDEEETDCEIIESSSEEEGDVIEIKEELEDDEDEYDDSYIMRASSRIILAEDDLPLIMMEEEAEEEEKKDDQQKTKVMVNVAELDEEENHPLVMMIEEEVEQEEEEEEEKGDEEQKMKVIVKEEVLEEEEDQGWRSSDNEQENGYRNHGDFGLGLEPQTYDQSSEANLGSQEPGFQRILDVRIKEEPEETFTW